MANQFVYLPEAVTQHPDLAQFDVGIINKQGDTTASVHFLRINRHIELEKRFLQAFELSETGDTRTNKVCDRCYKYLNTETDFENNRRKKGDLITKRPSCRTCRKQKNGKSISASDRRKWEEQRPTDGSLFTCPICTKTTIAGIVKIVLDHNHHTGEVRGWLCESCNTGIGRFDDSIEQIERAKAWLSR